MDRPRHQLLARAAFAGDENSGIDARDLGDSGMDRGDGLTAPDHLVGEVQVSLQTVRFTFERPEPPEVVDRDGGNPRHRCRQLQMIVRERHPGAGRQINRAERAALNRQGHRHNRRRTRLADIVLQAAVFAFGVAVDNMPTPSPMTR